MASIRGIGGTAAALAMVAVVGLTTQSSAQATPRTPNAAVPENLKPPAGNTEIARYRASGVQVYRCTGQAWVFVEPVASLTSHRGHNKVTQAIHFRGPSWQSVKDGSLVEAKALANSPVEGAIPELLLEATTTRGDGVFGQVTYVQRLNTKGGLAPAGSCTDGNVESVKDQADYRFFAKSS